jgi:hypothetical protein
MSLYRGNSEPTVDELLDEEIVRLLIERDLLTVEEVRACLEAARRRLRMGQGPWPPRNR